METVSQDSLKHSLIYETIINVLSESGPMLSEEELGKISEEISDHIRTEEEMIRKIESILNENVENKVIEFLLKSILKDEYYHHSLLKRVHEMIIRKETLTESEIWDLIWQDVGFHGTPGG